MLDRDLATLYGVETKRLNEQVRRNIKRFPEDFMFQLTKDECLRSQIATLNEGRGQHLKYMPYVFTEKVHFRLFVTTTFLMSSVLLHAFKLCRCSNWKYKSQQEGDDGFLHILAIPCYSSNLYPTVN